MTVINKQVSFKGKNGVVPESVRVPLKVAHTLMEKYGVHEMSHNGNSIQDVSARIGKPAVYIEFPKDVYMTVDVTTGMTTGLLKVVSQPLWRIFKQMKTSLDGFVANFANDNKVTKTAKPGLHLIL